MRPVHVPPAASSAARRHPVAARPAAGPARWRLRGGIAARLLAGWLLLPLPLLAQTTSGATDVQRLVGEGKHAQALKVIDDALAKTPKDPQLQFQRGVVLSMLNRRPEALEAFKKLVADNPNMAPAYNNMAVIYAAMSDYENAKLSLDKAIRISPEYATAYQNLGDVYVQFATQAYQKSLQLDKTDPGLAPKLALLQDVLLPPAERSGTLAAAGGKGGAKAGAKGAAAAPAAVAPPAPVITAMAPPTAPLPAAAPRTAPPALPAAASPALPAATTAAPSSATAAGADASTDVSATVRRWATAWSARDAAAYTTFYAPTFTGQAKTHDAWQRERIERITQRSRIKVDLSDLVVSVIGDKAEVRFRQTYESDGPKEVSRKQLTLQRDAGGQWLITKETSGG